MRQVQHSNKWPTSLKPTDVSGRSPCPLLDMTTTASGLLCWRDFHPQDGNHLAALVLAAPTSTWRMERDASTSTTTPNFTSMG
jgi:hypothetical protein